MVKQKNRTTKTTKTIDMKAEEFVKDNYSNVNSWKNYPPCEAKVVEMMEQYANQRLVEKEDEMSFLAEMYGLYAHEQGVWGKVGVDFMEWKRLRELGAHL